MLNYIKLLISDLFHKGNYSSVTIIKDLRTKGYHYIPNFLTEDEIRKVVMEFELLFEQDHLVKEESNGCDMRIYGADERANFKIKKLDDFSGPLFKSFSFFRKAYHFILLGWLKKGENNLGSGGGWHRDSPISHQFKTILYLTDVSDDNGPFQFIEGSQNWKNNIKVSKYLKIPISERRFKNEQIDLLIEDNIIPKPITFCSKKGGLIIADTRGLHRGKPLEEGERKAITRYHFVSDIGSKFYI